MKKLLAAAAILVISATAAQASTIFDFTTGINGTLGDMPSLSYSQGGINLTVSSAKCGISYGQCNAGQSVETSGDIQQYNGFGLGIKNYGEWQESHQVDSANWNDVAIFNFSKDVTLESVSFSLFDPNDDFAFFFDVGDDGNLTVNGGDLINASIDGFSGAYLLSALALGDFTGDLFGIGALGYDGDEFKIKSITVSAVSSVPVPAALPLMGSGLALLGFMGWRRKRQAAKA